MLVFLCYFLKYEDIYNTSRNSKEDNTSLQDTMNYYIAVKNSIAFPVVEGSEVSDGIKSLKHIKCGGSEGMYWNHLLLSSTLFREHIALSFTAMHRHGYNSKYMPE